MPKGGIEEQRLAEERRLASGTEEQRIARERDRLTWVLFDVPKEDHPDLYRAMRKLPEVLYGLLDGVAGGSDRVAADRLFARLIFATAGRELERAVVMLEEIAAERARWSPLAKLLILPVQPRPILPVPPRVGGDWCKGARPPRLKTWWKVAWNATPWNTTPWRPVLQ
jgi:hypothetical protein